MKHVVMWLAVLGLAGAALGEPTARVIPADAQRSYATDGVVTAAITRGSEGRTGEGRYPNAFSDCASPFEDISGTGAQLPLGDDDGEVVSIGFTFNFYGDDHTDIGVSSNGYLTFGPTLTDFSNDPVPSTIDPDDLVAPFWDDLNPGAGGTVHYQTLGAAPNRRFIAQWTNVPEYLNTGANTFQAVLYEDSNCIEFRYGPFTADVSGTDVTIGIENQDGTAGVAVVTSTIQPGDCASICPLPPACSGDTCADTLPVPGLPFSDVGDTCSCTNNYDEVCPYPGSLSPDRVYAYTPPSNVTVDITLCTNSAYDTKLYVYENSCPGTVVGCNDDICSTPSYPAPYVSELENLALTAGNTYYIVVDGYGGQCGTFTLDILELCGGLAPPLNWIAATWVGGGGDGAPVVETGRWTFDILSDAQRDAPTNCQNTVLNPFGEVLVDFGWQPSAESSIPPRVELVDPNSFDDPNSLDVGGGVLAFYDPATNGYLPLQLSLMESPVADFDAVGVADEGPLELTFWANSNPVPTSLVFVVGSRVLENGEWTAWCDAEVPILPGPQEYRVALSNTLPAPGAGGRIGQVRIGVENQGDAPVPDKGPAVDEVRLEVKKEPAGTWKYVPDVSQDDKAWCQASAFTNCMSYWANNGYPELLLGTGPTAQKHLITQRQLAELIHGRERRDGEQIRKEGGKGDVAFTEYLKARGVYRGQPQPEGRRALEHVRASNAGATWDHLTGQFGQCHDVLLRFEWYKPDDTPVRDPNDPNRIPAHYVTVAGVVDDPNDPKKGLWVANPWGESHHEPNVDTRNDAYDRLTVQIVDGRIRVRNEDLLRNAAGVRGAAYLCVTAINIIRPVAQQLVDAIPAVPSEDSETRAPAAPDAAALDTYAYTVFNEETTPLNYFAMIVELPYQNVQSPAGWTWQSLPANYPHTEGCNAVLGPAGILWTTETNPVPPGGQIGGFSFEAHTLYAPVDDGPVWYTETEGHEGRFGFVWGPVPAAGDFDGDGDVDLDDFGSFAGCYNGANDPPAPGCPEGVDADLDGDGDVDLDDFSIFAANFTGSL